MSKILKSALLGTALTAATATAVMAEGVELEVTHWWTSGGEAAAVAKFADAWNATGNTWVDGAIAGSGGTARPIIISRIIGGDPMAATQLNHGRQAEELIEAGLLLDLTDVAEAGGWAEIVNPSSLLDACTLDGKIYCVPVNIHSAQWIWLSHAAYESAGLDVPTDWNEFTASAGSLKEAGILPLAMGQQGWQQNIAFGAITLAVAGQEAWNGVNIDKNADVARGPEYTAAFEAVAAARDLAAESNVQDWNMATNLVITGQAGAQIMGDWAQGEFSVAEQVEGKDYSCLPGLGLNPVIDTGGDAFYFPVNDDPAITAAQKELAALLISPEVQVSFNLAKGSLPVRGDIDMSTANGCMQKGLEILANGGVLPSGDISFSQDTTLQIEDLQAQFWSSDMSAADAQAAYADIIANAD
ncbi:ABC transporter substrate-binding protein [Planktomarina temperata]|uniref:ABC transporter substrate-binding protein n=1 Tax=uncultured Planktomarina sp. TaxID=1538529 RepID=UPI0023024008|nr:ABC transporter substrate-binding protein [Planktomarina temperata]MDA9082779.1 ABC transporter substrate-binding protein [bacterium]MDC0122607.1 ABC transporter substrate-binding protein [Planktomarina sp.]MDA7475569.1 ABC transporter substrate-binding protein [Planktomarina temperata]MDA8907624.1 ABC transporter substrate-binding protein [Planktomarina temperata]